MKRPLLLSFVSVLVALAAGFAFVPRAAMQNGYHEAARALAADASWTPTGSLITGRSGHTETLLPNGKVLVAGGYTSSNVVLDTAELYDPATGTWAPTGNLDGGRRSHTATLLQNGKVLIVGGVTNMSATAVVNWTQLYDPATGAFSSTNNRLSVGRYSHTATLLSNGKVLVAGGQVSPGTTSTAEIYDPNTFLWTPTSSMQASGGGITGTLLQNGKVLVTGTTTEIYDPATATWNPAAALPSPRGAHTATLLPNGRVLVAGGGSNNVAFSSSYLYDPSANSWTPTGSLLSARFSHTATSLQDGRVLVAGGSFGLTELKSAEIYDPVAGTWTATSDLNLARTRHTAVMLSSGTVLVVSGESSLTPRSAELYDPGTSVGTNLEGDVVDANGGPLGDGFVLANDVQVIRLFVLGLATPSTSSNQFQRADINDFCGDSLINAADVTVVRLMSLGILVPTSACGPLL